MTIPTYAREPTLTASEFQQLLLASGLALRRPAADLPRLDRMLRGSNLILTARLPANQGGTLVGIARSVTDFAYCCYLSDLAVSESMKGKGIGRALIAQTRAAVGPDVAVILLSAPAAASFYESIPMRRHPAAFYFPSHPDPTQPSPVSNDSCDAATSSPTDS